MTAFLYLGANHVERWTAPAASFGQEPSSASCGGGPLNGEVNWFVAYVCTWTGAPPQGRGSRIDCRDQACSRSYWQLQGARAVENSPAAGGNSAADGASSGTSDSGPKDGSLVLSYKTFLGGSNFDTARDVAYDAAGDLYTSGGTLSVNFPTSRAVYDTTHNGNMDVFLTKHDRSGTLVWSTLIGGPNYDRAYAVEVDATGVYVAGRAGFGYPTTSGVVQGAFGGDGNPNPAYGPQDGFISKFSHDGQLVWSTFLGGADRSIVRDIAVDATGLYAVMPYVSVPTPHATPGTFQAAIRGRADGLVVKIALDGSRVLWGTYLGGSHDDLIPPTIRVDAGGHPVIFGLTYSENMPLKNAFDSTLGGTTDYYVAKLTPDGQGLVFATYLGGSRDEDTETHQLALDASGSVYVAMSTQSSDLRTTGYDDSFNSAGTESDGYVVKLTPSGQFVAGTYIGGSGRDDAEGIAVDGQGRVGITGRTTSTDLPMVGAVQETNRGGLDGYFALFSNDLSQLLRSTYLGGSEDDLGRELDVTGGSEFLAGGETKSADFGTAANAAQRNYAGAQDAWIAVIKP